MCVFITCEKSARAFGGPKITENGSPSESRSQGTRWSLTEFQTNGAQLHVRKSVKIGEADAPESYFSFDIVQVYSRSRSTRATQPVNLSQTTTSLASAFRAISFKSGIFQDVAERALLVAAAAVRRCRCTTRGSDRAFHANRRVSRRIRCARFDRNIVRVEDSSARYCKEPRCSERATAVPTRAALEPALV